MQVTLKNLVNRIKMDEELLENHPENKEMLNKHISETKECIIQCILSNRDNPLLDKIVMR